MMTIYNEEYNNHNHLYQSNYMLLERIFKIFPREIIISFLLLKTDNLKKGLFKDLCYVRVKTYR